MGVRGQDLVKSRCKTAAVLVPCRNNETFFVLGDVFVTRSITVDSQHKIIKYPKDTIITLCII